MLQNSGLQADFERLHQLDPADFFTHFDRHFRIHQSESAKSLSKHEPPARVIVNLRSKFDEQYRLLISSQNASQTPKVQLSKQLIPFFKDKLNTSIAEGSSVYTHSKHQDKENRNPNIMNPDAEYTKPNRTVLRKREKDSPQGSIKDQVARDPRTGSVGELRIEINQDLRRLEDSLYRDTRPQEISIQQLLKRSSIGRVTPKSQYFPPRREDTHGLHTESSLDNLLPAHNSHQPQPLHHNYSSSVLHSGASNHPSNTFLLRKLIREANLGAVTTTATAMQPSSSRIHLHTQSSGQHQSHGVTNVQTAGQQSRDGLRHVLGLGPRSTKGRDTQKLGRSLSRQQHGMHNRDRSLKENQLLLEDKHKVDNKGSKSSLASDGSQMKNMIIGGRQCHENGMMSIDEPSKVNMRCNLLRAVFPSVGRSDVSTSHLGLLLNQETGKSRRDNNVTTLNRVSDLVGDGVLKSKNHKSYANIGMNGMSQMTSNILGDLATGAVSNRESKVTVNNPIMSLMGMLSNKSKRMIDVSQKKSVDLLDRQTHPNRVFVQSKDDAHSQVSYFSAEIEQHKCYVADRTIASRNEHRPNKDTHFAADYVFITDERQLVNNVQEVTSIDKILSKAKVYGEQLMQNAESGRQTSNVLQLEELSTQVQDRYAKYVSQRAHTQTGSVDLGTRLMKKQLETAFFDQSRKNKLKSQVQELLSSKARGLHSGDRPGQKHLLLGDLMHQGAHSNALREKANKILYGDKHSKDSSLDRHPSGVWCRPPTEVSRTSKPESQLAGQKAGLKQMMGAALPAKLLMRN